MPLKVKLRPRDVVVIGETRVTVYKNGANGVTLIVDAPKELKISREMNNNDEKIEKGQLISPEQQRNNALKLLNRGNI